MPVTLRSRPTGLIDAIRAEAEREPDTIWCHHLADGKTVDRTATRRELDEQCRRIALFLSEFVRPGDRVLVMCEPGIDYIAAFLGCLYAGVIPVPAYPPSPLVLDRSLARLDAVVRDADPAYAITSRLLAPILDGAPLLRRRDGSPVRHLCLDDAIAPADAWHGDALGSGDDPAFLQYTSGSTGDPKGVVIRHRNLFANMDMITRTFGSARGTASISWLPPYHDMGLVGLILWPLASGGSLVLMPPEAFLKRPENWVSAIDRFNVRLTASPNFGYALAARRVPEHRAAELDLQSFEVAINGAESVSAPTMQAFSERFAPAGFRPSSFYPAYGMAEATLLIASAPWQSASSTRTFDAAALEAGRLDPVRDDAPARTVTSCGPADTAGTVRVLTLDDDSDAAPGQIGELTIGGPHVATGYWGQSDFSNQPGVGFRTGDLGSVVDGEVFVTGRIKDLIIIRGRNHYPQDIEETAEAAYHGIRPGCTAAFSLVVDGSERVVIATEVNEDNVGREVFETATRSVAAAVNAVHGLTPHAVVLLAPRTIPKTSSGKIQRSAARAAYESGTLQTVRPAESDPALGIPA